MNTPELPKQGPVFDIIGEQYDIAFANKSAQEAATRWLMERLPAGAKVLDAGCGSGLPTAKMLTEAGFEVLGIDVSEGMLRLARRNVPGARFERMEMESAELPAGHFDAVTSFFALLMLPQAGFVPAVRHLASRVRPGGYVVLSMVEGELDWVPVPFLGQTLHVSAFPQAELKKRLEEAGLEVLEVQAVDFEAAAPGAPPERQLYVHCRTRG